MNCTIPDDVLTIGNFNKCFPNINFKLSNNINDNKYYT